MIKKEIPENLVQMLNISTQAHPDKTAVYFADKKFTYGQLWHFSDRFAQGLKNLGIESGSSVAIFLLNSPEFIFAYFGIIKAGAIAVPINNMFKQRETEFIIEDAQASCVVTSLAYLDIIRPSKEKLRHLKYIILVDGITADTLNFYEIVERTTAELKPGQIGGDSAASILYISGTTGQPKGAMLTHRNFVSNCSACAETINLRKTDNFICLLPMFHSFAWTVCVLLPLYGAAAITIIDFLRPFRKVIRNVIKKKVTVFVAIPSIYHILEHMHIPPVFTSRVLKMIDPLRICISGAAALPAEVLKEFEAKFRVPLLEGYGLTEASAVVSINPMRGTRKSGSVGLPLEEIEIKVVNENDEELPAGEIGELLVKGPDVMKGYFKNEEATNLTLKHGWLYTGDLSRVDREGYISIVDREKRI